MSERMRSASTHEWYSSGDDDVLCSRNQTGIHVLSFFTHTIHLYSHLQSSWPNDPLRLFIPTQKHTNSTWLFSYLQEVLRIHHNHRAEIELVIGRLGYITRLSAKMLNYRSFHYSHILHPSTVLGHYFGKYSLFSMHSTNWCEQTSITHLIIQTIEFKERSERKQYNILKTLEGWKMNGRCKLMSLNMIFSGKIKGWN